MMIYDIFVNCSWFDIRSQQYSTVHIYTQYAEKHNDIEYLERNIYNNKNT